MLSQNCFALSAALWTLIASASAYDGTARTNVAMYYGQGPGEPSLGLQHFCDNNDVDIIPLGFLNIYPAQGNGYPGTNFAASCWATAFPGPGYNNVSDHAKDQLLDHCPSLVAGISYCQKKGKKIILSLGGAVAQGKVSYELTSNDDAIYLADFLWGAFGPKDNTASYPRPFDLESTVQEVDGFDFDIESIKPGEQAYYVTLIQRLRSHFPTGPGAKEYVITGAPQCIVPDHNMADMIAGAQFDILFVQYYNTPACSGRNWITANPNYESNNVENSSGFKQWFTQLDSNLAAGASKNAKIYFGLPGSTAAVLATDYLDPATEIAPFVDAYFCHARFGGVTIWEAAYAEGNVQGGNTFQKRVKDVLIARSTKTKNLACAPPAANSATSSPTHRSIACCLQKYIAVSGDSCLTIATNHGIQVSQLEAMNPSLGSGPESSNIQPGYELCVMEGACSVISTTGSISLITSTYTTSSSSTARFTSTTPSPSTSSSTTPNSSASITSNASTTPSTSTSSNTTSTSSIATTSSIQSTSSASTSTPSSSSSSSSSPSSSPSTATHAAPTATSAPFITTTTTKVYTITSCPPTVTSCPLGQVTTDILTVTTTYCPSATAAAPFTTSWAVGHTTSVVYTTLIYTITACPVTATNCPAKLGSVTTETRVLYTTVCPISAYKTPVSIPITAVTGSPQKQISYASSIGPTTTTTSSSTTTVYKTVYFPKSSSSTFAVVFQTINIIPTSKVVSPSRVVPISTFAPAPKVVPSGSPIKPGAAQFTSSAESRASLSVRGALAVVLCMAGWALM